MPNATRIALDDKRVGRCTSMWSGRRLKFASQGFEGE